MKHYGQFLAWAGNPIKYKSRDIELLYAEKETLKIRLRTLEKDIKEKEKEFAELIASDWNEEEIQEAKNKANS
mgnify:CR=1 FL=1